MTAKQILNQIAYHLDDTQEITQTKQQTLNTLQQLIIDMDNLDYETGIHSHRYDQTYIE